MRSARQRAANSRSSALRRVTRTYLPPVVSALVLLAGWQFLSSLPSVAEWMLPAPGSVFSRLGVEFSRPTLWRALGWTALEAALGCLAGALIAFPLAYLIYRSRVIAAAVEPFLGATQAIPAIALAPLLVIWVGYGTAGIVALCTVIVFFPILLSTTLGLRHLDPDIIDAARLDGASGWSMLRDIEIPMAIPAIATGLRNGFTLSVTGAVVGEMVMGGVGLGTVLTIQRNAVDTTGMFVTILLLCALAMIVYLTIAAAERRRKSDYRYLRANRRGRSGSPGASPRRIRTR